MLRDASQKKVIHKFSFIHSLDLSRGLEEEESMILKPKINSPSPGLATASFSQSHAAAIVPAVKSNWHQSSDAKGGLTLAEIVKYSTPNNLTSTAPKSKNYLGKILFSLATAYCLFVLWWLFGHEGNRLLTALTGGKQVVLSKSDAKFIDYAERSLESIERELAADKAKEEKVVYVPVYTPNSAPAPSIPSVANRPLNTLPSIQSPSPSPSSVSEPLKIPAPPPLPAPTPITSTPIEQPAKVAIAKPEIKSTLIGILELGENKSAALVQVKGQTKRVWLGERINNDGWILESVGNETANITYQGQIRSISVGEVF